MRAALALAVVAAGLSATPASAATPPVTGVRSVTLISGDRLQVAADGRSASRLPSPGRDAVPLLIRLAGGRLRVVPADAVPLLEGDRLDPRLFDVTGLLAAGQGAPGGELPLIVRHADGGTDAAVRAAAGAGPGQELDAIGASAVRVPAARVPALWSGLTGGRLDGTYRKIWLDGIVTPRADDGVPLVGAPAAWAAGYTGDGVPVGVLDTGVDAGHPDLLGTVAEAADFTTTGDGLDRDGHGTHVASVVAGSGAASAGRYRGMAPDVRLFSAKVCATVCRESAVLAGMQWVARDKHVKVANLSLGRTDEPGTDLLEEAVGTLTEAYGTLFVVAAGNDGTVSSPASADAALAVGASDRNDRVARFSGAGPDLVAPGVRVTAARPGGGYATRSGTSVAAAHVTGAAAILAQAHPDFSPAELAAALTGAATPLDAAPQRAGAGRLDVAKAVDATVTATPSVLRAGDAAGTVRYRNTGPAAVTLALTVDGPFRPDATAVTVPARGHAGVRVTPAPGASPSAGVLTASSGPGRTVRTPLEGPAETVTLTVRYTDRAGAPARRASGGVYPLDGSGFTAVPGDGTVRLPKGTYTLDAAIFETGATTLVNRPVLRLDRDTTVEMDARRGAPVRVAAPRAGAGQVSGQVAFVMPTAGGPVAGGLLGTTFDGLFTAQAGPGDGPPGFRTDVSAAWARRDPGGTGHNSPYLYALAWSVPGRYVTGFDRAVDPAGLTEIRSDYGAGRPGTTGTMTRTPAGSPGGHTSTFDLPFRRTEYLSAGARWPSAFTEVPPSGPALAVAAGDARPGAERWNTGVLSPAVAGGHGITRSGDTLTVGPSWFTGADGHAADSPAATHRTVVRRAGAVVADTAAPAARVTVPAGEAGFTVTHESTRPAATSVRTRTRWTFRSGRTAGSTPLPVAVVRFTPRPDGVLAYTVRHQAGGTTAAVGLEVSYDDGRTWRRPVTGRIGDHGVAFLRPPKGFVSVRATAADTAGNTVEQTVIRAYATG